MFLLLLRSYRRQDAQQNMFLLSLLLCGMTLVTPDALLFFPVVWWTAFMLRASNLRTYMASLIAILTVLLYASLVWFIWPDSALILTEQMLWEGAFMRAFCWDILPLWALIVSGVAVVIGLWLLIAHLRNYPRANVRIQTRIQLVAPAFFLAMLSVFFPPLNGLTLMPLLWLASLYMTVLYLTTYGFPRMSLSSNNRRSSSSRRLSRRADSHNPFRRKKTAAYGSPRRSFSRSSRGRSRYAR